MLFIAYVLPTIHFLTDRNFNLQLIDIYNKKITESNLYIKYLLRIINEMYFVISIKYENERIHPGYKS